jgi:hypothetical protein
MFSQASAEPLRASTRAQASHLDDRTSSPSLPIDAIFAPPLQDRPRRSVRNPQIPIGRALHSPSSTRFPPWEAFGRQPRRLASTVAKGRPPKPFTKADLGADT